MKTKFDLPLLNVGINDARTKFQKMILLKQNSKI